MFEVNVTARSAEPFAELLGPERVVALQRVSEEIRGLLGAHAVFNVSSTATGGGVAEMLRSLLRYARGLGILARWAVIEGPPEFFRITKRLHNAMHGCAGDGSPLGAAEAALYEQVTKQNAVALDALIRPEDVVVCHDPQTAGLIPHFVCKGMRVVWRCHIGHDQVDPEVELAWNFLRKYVEQAPYSVFSRQSYAPSWLHHKQTIVLPPNIDPFSAKNQFMDEATTRAILFDVGLVGGPRGDAPAVFSREDGSVGRVDRQAEVVRVGPAPSWKTPLVVQVSRWDTMKDPLGVLRGFTECLAPDIPRDAALVLAGPGVRTVADDPEAPQVLRSVETYWRQLPDSLRRTAHLVQLPMEDTEENAAIVNALQRHATVVVQKSLREGFGLTVTEAMWKRRPVIASAVGGIQDQIQDGVDGLLLRNPEDPREFANALRRVLSDEALAERLGRAGFERVRDEYLGITSLENWAAVVRLLFSGTAAAQP
ncbi:Trehalose synthase [Labilithrix luteola]|uniref:Trehalose synthase n=1 Tax=Labilithrix luteola TaxID=1391654 RepID=A0A0K1PSV2_9BACT|nr:glycosyltransferase [Labilithrix luteola]AKU96613.1 Trehalose synthase [Labilithrix luteola]